MKKLISVWLIISFFTLSGGTFSKVFANATKTVSTLGKGIFTLAIYGYDESAYNTDSILIINFDAQKNNISFLQIPRDTYFSVEDVYTGKINGVVPSLLNKGNDILGSSQKMTDCISDSLGIRIDGFIGLTPSAVSNFIDTLGGVEINIPIEITGKSLKGETIKLNKGYNLLDGEAAIVLLRHRASYPLGDLERMDMQKLFLSALSARLFERLNIPLVYKLVSSQDKGIYSNLNLLEFLIFAIKESGRIKTSTLCFATLPGTATTSNKGVSFYSVNYYASNQVLKKMFYTYNSSFDANNCFLNKNDKKFYDIYFSKELAYKIYFSQDLKDINFIVTQ